MAIELPPLPYDRAALEPHVSGETIDYHYGKHHKAYVDNLNKMIEGTEFADMALEDIIRKSQGAMFNNAAQVWNHTFYWHCLSPKGGGEPSGKVADAIAKAFGGYDKFKEQFTDTAIKTFGSGWAWLAVKNGKLRMTRTSEEVVDDPVKPAVASGAGDAGAERDDGVQPEAEPKPKPKPRSRRRKPAGGDVGDVQG